MEEQAKKYLDQAVRMDIVSIQGAKGEYNYLVTEEAKKFLARAERERMEIDDTVQRAKDCKREYDYSDYHDWVKTAGIRLGGFYLRVVSMHREIMGYEEERMITSSRRRKYVFGCEKEKALSNGINEETYIEMKAREILNFTKEMINNRYPLNKILEETCFIPRDLIGVILGYVPLDIDYGGHF